MVHPYLYSFSESVSAVLPIGGFIIGLSFGAIIIITNFCTMGAIADIVTSSDYRRLRSWILAAAVALAGTQALRAAGLVDLTGSMYLRGGLNVVGALVGGSIFGFGMVLAGGCPSRSLARAGSGDLRALATLAVMAVMTNLVISGGLEPMRQAVTAPMTLDPPAGVTVALPDIAAYALGIADAGMLHLLLAAALALGAFSYCFADASFRASPRHVLAGLGVGGCAIAGWAVTALGQDDFALLQRPPASISFVRPVARTLDYLTGFAGSRPLGFGVPLVVGVLAGAMITALATGRFGLRGFSGAADTVRNLGGAALMGVGGALALGCSIGQGVTGVSTMAAGSFLAFAAMALGAVAGLKYLERRA